MLPVPTPAAQEFADDELDRLLGNAEKLPVVLDHSFQDGLPREKFSVAGGGWEDHFTQEPNGLRISRHGGHYVNFNITTPLVMSGDFDVTASIEQFQSDVVAGGEGNVQLMVVLGDQRSTECNLSRKRYVFENQREEQIIQPSVFEKRNGETTYSFFDAPAEESTSGKLRFSRRGRRLYWLYAEDDSPEFRVIHQEDVGADDATFKLLVGHHKDGSTSVLWKSLTVRSQTVKGLPSTPWATLNELDQQRASLPAKVEFDLSSKLAVTGISGLGQFQIWGGDTASFFRDQNGLKIDVPGADQWQAAGLLPRVRFEGDFDISLVLDVLTLEPCAVGNESTVLLQTEFNDALKSVSEVKYSIDNEGNRQAETQLRRARPDGSQDYQELQTKKASGASLLRLARRGDMIYQIFQESAKTKPLILGAMTVVRDPVPDGLLRALIHTGGAKRKTVVRFKAMSLHAEKLSLP